MSPKPKKKLGAQCLACGRVVEPAAGGDIVRCGTCGSHELHLYEARR